MIHTAKLGLLALTLTLGAAACGDADDLPLLPDTLQPDAGPPGDDLGADQQAPSPDMSCADLPDPGAAWVQPYQKEIVSRLTGNEEVKPGTTLNDRASVANRAVTRNYLAGALTTLGLKPQQESYGGGVNVYADLAPSGTSKDYIVVGAHYDSVTGSPGANDNATGVAAVLAAARYLSSVSCRGKNVTIVLFDQEEVGQLGSMAFAKRLFDDKLSIASVHTIDQVGWDSDGDRALELERPDPGLFPLYQKAVTLGGLKIPLTQTQTGGTDHVAFRAYGFPAVGITEEYKTGDTTPHYHSATDTYATVNFDYLASSTELVNVALAGILRGLLP
jgi:hypothetical protein